MKQENTSKKEKMIMVEKSTKWWMTVVASGSLAVGLLGGARHWLFSDKCTQSAAKSTDKHNNSGTK